MEGRQVFPVLTILKLNILTSGTKKESKSLYLSPDINTLRKAEKESPASMYWASKSPQSQYIEYLNMGTYRYASQRKDANTQKYPINKMFWKKIWHGIQPGNACNLRQKYQRN